MNEVEKKAWEQHIRIILHAMGMRRMKGETWIDPSERIQLIVDAELTRLRLIVARAEGLESQLCRAREAVVGLLKAAEEILANGYDQGRRITLRAALGAYKEAK